MPERVSLMLSGTPPPRGGVIYRGTEPFVRHPLHDVW
jgi:hypothetical protein